MQGRTSIESRAETLGGSRGTSTAPLHVPPRADYYASARATPLDSYLSVNGFGSPGCVNTPSESEPGYGRIGEAKVTWTLAIRLNDDIHSLEPFQSSAGVGSCVFDVKESSTVLPAAA